MDEFDKIVIIEPEITEDFGDDPDSKRKEELKGARHKNTLLFHKWLPRFVGAFIAVVVIMLFVILPISEMHYYYSSFWEGIRSYTRALRSTGIILATIVVTNLSNKLYEYIRKHVKDTE